jgi:pyruvate/2-oxoglutarate dehydrogenase complex dihydrolipoamide acyltransferase (E2) component
MMNPTAAFEVNITKVFFYSLSQQVQDSLESKGYQVPIMLATNEDHMDSLITLRNQVEQQEHSKIAQTSKIAIAATSSGRSSPPPLLCSLPL